MDNLKQIETLVSLNLATLSLQLVTHEVYGRNRLQADIVHQAKKLLGLQIQLINQIEMEFITEVESWAEKQLSQSAATLKSAKSLNGDEKNQDFDNMILGFKNTHQQIVSELSDIELSLESRISERFVRMRDEAEEILERFCKL
jgi:hypothetical protein